MKKLNLYVDHDYFCKHLRVIRPNPYDYDISWYKMRPVILKQDHRCKC
jgi:hypothetical protein